LTKVIQYSGFVEASAGIIQKGFAIRKVANLKFSISRDHKPKKLRISFFRTSKAWGCAKIGLVINNSKEFKLEATKLGKNSTEIDLIQFNSVRQFDLEFRIYPIGIKKHIINFFSSILLVNTKLLVRDSILISELFVDKKKILVFEDINRFNFSKSDTKNEIKVRILGFFSQTFGLAEASRRTLKAIQTSETKISATQIPYKGKHRGDEKCISVEKSLPVEKNEIRIFHFNGDHLERLILDWGSSILDCKYKIGFWHWELPDFPEDYLQWFDLVDEVWVPSKFVFDSIAPKSSKPVQIIPLALDEQILKPPPPNRKKFSIPDDKVVFLITFDFYSILERKNPIAGIKAFSKLIEDDKYKDLAHLVVKVSNQHSDKEGYNILLKTLSALSPKNITFIDKVLPRMDMMQLINSIDSLISLHRSEGFGLHLAEAMAMGKAVIATNWSGNTDFMNLKNSSLVDYDLVRLEKDFGPYRRDCRWASPVLDHAVSKMKILLENECTNAASIKIRARNEITEIHSLKNISSIIENRINVIWRNLERIEPQTSI
jgi:glycosyltransferase involved in cell wall biosynthesis